MLILWKYSAYFTYFDSLKPQDEEGISKEMNLVQQSGKGQN